MKEDKIEIVKQFDSLLNKKPSPSVFENSVIAIPDKYPYQGIIVYSEAYDVDLFDGPLIEDNITDLSNVPDKPGIYKCNIHALSYQSNNPQDPVEYDIDVWLEKVEKIEMLFKTK